MMLIMTVIDDVDYDDEVGEYSAWVLGWVIVGVTLRKP